MASELKRASAGCTALSSFLGAATFKGYGANNAWLVTVHNVIGPMASLPSQHANHVFGKEYKLVLSRN